MLKKLQQAEKEVNALQATELSPERLEQWLDRCDALADELDAYDEQGLKIDRQLELYENLVSRLEKLQDEWDELD